MKPNFVSFILNKVENKLLLIFFISDLGLLPGSIGSVSRENEIDYTPAGWTFSTWGIIYAWNGKQIESILLYIVYIKK